MDPPKSGLLEEADILQVAVAETELALTLNWHLQHLLNQQVLVCMLNCHLQHLQDQPVIIDSVLLAHHKSLETLALCMQHRRPQAVCDLESA